LQGDLTYRLTGGFCGAYRQIESDFNTAIQQLRETVAAIDEATREVGTASSEIATATTELSQRTEEQAASLEQTSASREEFAATVKKNADNAQQANKSAATTCNGPPGGVFGKNDFGGTRFYVVPPCKGGVCPACIISSPSFPRVPFQAD
jgi:ABC-type transporter Mla subunit MlaD